MLSESHMVSSMDGEKIRMKLEEGARAVMAGNTIVVTNMSFEDPRVVHRTIQDNKTHRSSNNQADFPDITRSYDSNAKGRNALISSTNNDMRNS